MHPKLIKTILFPVRDFLRGIPITKYLQELEETQWLKSSEIKELQNEKLRSLINHAFYNVPFYHEKMKEQKLSPKDIKTTDDLTKLPLLSREEVRMNFPNKIVACNIPKKDLTLCKTGGSTGQPLCFFLDKRGRAYDRAAYYRGLKWTGIDIGDPQIWLWGEPIIESFSKKIVNQIQQKIINLKIINAFQMSEAKLKKLVEMLRHGKPKLLRGYVSAVYLLAKYIEKEKINDVDIGAISLTAEKLFDYQRSFIERQFNCKVFDQYGCGEANSIAFECDKHEGLHITAEHVIVEILDRDGSPARDGETGTIVVTNLDNYALPFIRYVNGDMGKKFDKMCSCGRKLPLLKSIESRAIDIIVGKNGSMVYGAFFAHLLEEKGWITNLGIREFQVIQKTLQKLVIKIVAKKMPDIKNQKKFSDIIRQYLGDMKIEFCFVNSIPTNISGKKRFTISEVPIKWMK